MKNNTIGIIGGGSWATALAKLFCQQDGLHIHWWVRSEEVAMHLQSYGHNPNYLSSVQFQLDRINVSSSIHEVIKKSSYLVFAVPAAFLQKSLAGVSVQELQEKFIICAIKGVVPEKNLIPGKFFQQEFNVPCCSIFQCASFGSFRFLISAILIFRRLETQHFVQVRRRFSSPF